MIWADVAIADMGDRPECVHRAYLDPDEDWNGWMRPWFTKDEVERMGTWLPEFDDGLVYDAEEDTFTTTYDPDMPEVYQGADVDGMHLYPVGSGSWMWELVENCCTTTAM